MTGRCTVSGCGVILSSADYGKVNARARERNWAEYSMLREQYIAHMMYCHPNEFAVIHAHAVDYMKTLVTKFLESSDERLAETRHDVSRLFYWILMGDILLAKSQPHPPLIDSRNQPGVV